MKNFSDTTAKSSFHHLATLKVENLEYNLGKNLDYRVLKRYRSGSFRLHKINCNLLPWRGRL